MRRREVIPMLAAAAVLTGCDSSETRSSEPSHDVALAQAQLRYAVPAAAGFATDNNGYAGMTIAKLRRYDGGVREIEIVWTKRSSYCAEAAVGTTVYHQVGPAEPSKP